MRRILFLSFCCLLALPPALSAADEEGLRPAPFLPSWRLLSNEGKQQFISGYLQGWKDAVRILEVAIMYLKENPDRGVQALENIKQIYEIRELPPDELVKQIEMFYADPAHRDAPLSRAVTAAKAKMR